MTASETAVPLPRRPAGPAAAADEVTAGPAPTTRSPHRGRWYAIEAIASIGTAGLFLLWSRTITVDPLDRKGQVSGLAALQFRFALVAAVLVVALVLVHRWRAPAYRERAVTMGCAVIAGLTTGLVAGGIDVALRGTQWSLWAGEDDYAWILAWIRKLGRGEDVPDHYPPIIFYVIGAWAKIRGEPLAYALKDVQLIGTALFGPAAYLAWRLTLRPVWALGIGVVAMLPFIEPVKPYPQITLVMMIPVLVRYLQLVRRCAGLRVRRAVGVGSAYGIGIGLLFLLYSGWLVWCAGGFLVAFCLVAPWRRGWRQVLSFAAASLVAFTAVSWVHLRGLLAATGGTSDPYFYFDTFTDPAYFAMWRNDRPADVGEVWPPLGELGGVGLFTILLMVGLGIALWLGWRRTAVITLGLCVASAWFLRMWLASEQWETQTVRLYPRTTMVLLYCLLLLTGFAVLLATNAARGWRLAGLASPAAPPGSTAPVGLLLIPLLFLLASAGSATIDHYLPDRRSDHAGYFAWIAQTKRLLDGSCSVYGRLHGCVKPANSAAPTGVTPTPATPTPAVSGPGVDFRGRVPERSPLRAWTGVRRDQPLVR
jgi:galactan 5-O-arabinofuranosyltransferase